MTRIPLLLLGVSLAFALVACGDDDSGPQATQTSTTQQSAGPSVPDGVAAQYATIEKEVAAEGGDTTSGPWRVAYIVEPAEPWFEDGEFREPARGETHHIEILPFEKATGRLVPYVPITLEVVDSRGDIVAEKELDFIYGEFFHYAQNFSIPERGEYRLRVTLEPPTFLRHGEEQQAPALSEGATVEFEGVELARE